MSSMTEKQSPLGKMNVAGSGNWEEDKARLEEDIRSVIADAQVLLNSARNQVESQGLAAREVLREQLALLREKTQRAQTALRTRTQSAVQATDEYVHAKPWQAVGIAAFMGMCTGAIMRGRMLRRM